MSDRFRNKVLAKLVEDIERLSGGTFEQFGYRIMPLLHTGRWEERGTTIDGAPRKGTVDTSSNGAAYVGEMSSTEGYFDDMAKAEKDLEHALKLHPQAKHIWLLSSREASSGQTTDIANTISDFRLKHPTVETADILDARAIASQIFGHLGRKDLVESLSSYLPTIARLADEHGFSHAIPPIANLIPRPALETKILSMLAASPRIILQGMSGAGKTALAARIATQERRAYDNVVWVDARDITSIAALSNIDVNRSDFTHNIATLLREERILLILDDPGFALSELESLPCGESKILVTSQVATGKYVIQVHDVDESEALAILTYEVATPCPSEIVDIVRSTVGGHALLLRALNRLAFERGWEAVRGCLRSDSIAGLEDELHEKIVRRVLQRQMVSLADELAFVQWCMMPRFHVELASLVSSLAIDNLAKRGFLAATTPGYVRVHDLVFKAIVAEIVVTGEQKARFTDRLARLVREESDSDRLLLQRLARTQGNLFKRLLSEARDPAFVYMVALGRFGEDSISLLGEPWKDAGILVARTSLAGSNLEVRTVIETVEALNTLRSDYRSKEEARAGLEKDISALTLLLEHEALSAEQRKMLEHHYAKMLIRLDREGEAQSIFRGILARDPTFAAARLQLARILPKDAAIIECEQILAQNEASRGTISLNVILEALRVLALNDVDMTQYESLIMSSIEQAGEMDLALAIGVISSIAQRVHFKSPELVLHMFKTVDWRAFVAAPNERFDWAQAHKFAAKSVRNDQELRDHFLKAAVDVYEQASLTKPYHRIQYADALLQLKRYAEANRQLDAIPPEQMDVFSWQRKAQALAGLGDLVKALVAINNAIGALTTKEERYRSTFLADRYRIRRDSGDVGAVEDLDKAIELLPPSDKHRKLLEAERALSKGKCD